MRHNIWWTIYSYEGDEERKCHQAGPRTRKEYDEDEKKKLEKSYKANKLLVCGIGLDKYNQISACESANKIWDLLKIMHEGISQVKESKVTCLPFNIEHSPSRESETVQEMHTRFTSITNVLHCLGEVIPPSKQVRKILGFLPKSWKSKVNAIFEARNLKTITIDKLIGKLKTYS